MQVPTLLFLYPRKYSLDTIAPEHYGKETIMRRPALNLRSRYAVGLLALAFSLTAQGQQGASSTERKPTTAGKETSASAYPNKPIRLIVPYGPGGGVDVVARTVADYLNNQMGKTVVVENRAGAGGNVGSAFVVKSEPDGYTLLVASNSNAVNNSLYDNMSYNAATDLTPITLVGIVPMVLLVSPTISPTTVQEVVALAKAKPGSLNVGSGGSGTGEHLAFEMFKRQTGINAQHIPYKGGSAVYTDLIGGQVQLFFNNQLGAAPHIRSGQLKAVGVTGDQRSPEFPNLPTFAEQGFSDFKAFVWWGIMGPANMPSDTLKDVSKLFAQAVASPEVQKKLRSLGAQPEGGNAEKFKKFFEQEMGTWSALIKEANIKLTE